MYFTLITSIISYTIFASLLYHLGMQSSKINLNVTNNCHPLFDKYMKYAVLLFIIMTAFRYSVGSDCESYATVVESGNFGENRSTDLEPLFLAWCTIVYKLGLGRIVFFALIAFVQIWFMYKSMASRRYLLPFFGLVMVLGSCYGITLTNGVRQQIVACIFLLAIQQLVDNPSKKQFVRYFVLLFISYFIHSSVVILVPLAALAFYNYLPNRYIVLAILLSCVFLARMDLIDSYLTQADLSLSMLGYEDYSNNLEYYMESDATVSTYGPRRLALLFTYIFIILYSKKMDKYYDHDRFFRVVYLLFVVYACATELLLGKVALFSRPFTYFSIMVPLSASYLLWYLKKNGRPVILTLALLITCSYNFMANLAEFKNPDETICYKSIIIKDWYH